MDGGSDLKHVTVRLSNHDRLSEVRSGASLFIPRYGAGDALICDLLVALLVIWTASESLFFFCIQGHVSASSQH